MTKDKNGAFIHEDGKGKKLPSIQKQIQSALLVWNNAISDFPSLEESDSFPISNNKSIPNEALNKVDKEADEVSVNNTGILVPETNLNHLFGIEAYEERLRTFKIHTYFAKPRSISPLVCARFGWVNTSKDLLKCCNPDCRGVVDVSMHHLLGEDAVSDLAAQYCRLLAKSHSKCCPFRADAERWLITNTSSISTKEFWPLYLTSTCQDLSMFNNSNLFDTKNQESHSISVLAPTVVHRKAGDFNNVFTCIYNNMGIDENEMKIIYQVKLPKAFSNYLMERRHTFLQNDTDKKYQKYPPEQQSIVLKEFLDFYTAKVLKPPYKTKGILDDGLSLKIEPSIHVQSQQRENLFRDVYDIAERKEMKQVMESVHTLFPPHPNTPNLDFIPSQQSACLAIFGWSPIGVTKSKSKKQTKVKAQVLVQCHVCLAKATVNVWSVVKDPPRAIKRPKIVNHERKDSRMNPITSHRFFCPYATTLSPGNENIHTDASLQCPETGWQVISDKLIQYWMLEKEMNANLKRKHRSSHSGKSTLSMIQKILSENI